MFSDYSRKELALILAAFLFAGALTAWGTYRLVNGYLDSRPERTNDPITKAGGLKPEQKK